MKKSNCDVYLKLDVCVNLIIILEDEQQYKVIRRVYGNINIHLYHKNFYNKNDVISKEVPGGSNFLKEDYYIDDYDVEKLSITQDAEVKKLIITKYLNIFEKKVFEILKTKYYL